MAKQFEIKVIVGYVLFFISTLFCLNKLFFPEILNEQNFLNWDATHYEWIKNFGYKDFRVAFFPLFPMLWKLSKLSIYGIVILNTLIFLVSFYFLIKSLNISSIEIILYLSIPSFFFFVLPYTESVFFASSTILLIGIKKKNNIVIMIGLLLSTLSRPAFTIFIPALIITELVSENLDKKMILRISLGLLVISLGIILVGIIQHLYTGIWFNFFEVQQGWGNKLQTPNFPLTSWAGGLIVRLDGAAMLVGTISGFILIAYILKAKFIKHIVIPKEIVFSLAYIAGITFAVFLFRGGSLFSLNRFVLAVPFIILITNFYMQQHFTFNTKQLLIGFILIFAFWLAFGSYVHIQTLLKFLLLSVYLFLLLLIKSNNKILSQTSFVLFILTNIVFQFVFFIRFLENDWVG